MPQLAQSNSKASHSLIPMRHIMIRDSGDVRKDAINTKRKMDQQEQFKLDLANQRLESYTYEI